MNKLDFKLEFEEAVTDKENGMPVIIVAAGSSSRMKGINKQLISVAGIPVIARTMLAFENCPLISKIILVTREELMADMQSIAQKYMINKLDCIVEGGEDRHASVIKGIKALSTQDEKALIHDGARPFINNRIITDCIKALGDADGCLCGIKINDTVKRVGEKGNVLETVDRSSLYGAQTPQGVDVKCYMDASEKLKGETFTDDASVLEMAGYTVKMVEGSNQNIKITCAEDLILAESIIVKGEI
ncbi:MAG: 2-C-methyl-D-erythritol 4-phosphate cytidylyltransferase [Clostridia bacterium]|nr:2-C-methyl-D-erythritol 4-phosphate cytidylyltransferase [Clostridia bacterium]